MSDFFTRLAQRTLRQAEVIQPLVPARYSGLPIAASPEEFTHATPAAPIVPTAMAEVVAAAPVDAVEPEFTSLDSRSAASQRTSRQRRAAPRAAVDPRPNPQFNVAADDTVATAAPDFAASSSGPREDRAVEAPMRPQPNAGRESESTVISTPKTGFQRPAEKHLNALRTESPSDATVTSPSDDLARAHLAPTSVTRPAPEPDRVAAGPRPPVIQAHPAQPLSSAMEQTAPEPSIEVHIGRIEVRAVDSAPRLAPREPQGPSLALADYLKSRDQGRR